MSPRPESPQERLERIVTRLCRGYYGRHGTGAHRHEAMAWRAEIWRVTKRKPSLGAFEEVLTELAKRDQLDSNSLTLACGSLDVHPSDPDYAATKAEHIQVQDELILEAVRALIPQQ